MTVNFRYDDKVRVGFTGTQAGLSSEQRATLTLWLEERSYGVNWFVHGDCVGADEQAAGIARVLGWKLECFPSDRPDKRAYVKSDVVHDPADPLDRNWNLASQDILIACPLEDKEIKRSGTWSTVRRARKRGTLIVIIWRDGTIDRYGPDDV